MPNPVPALLETWRSLRAELRAQEEAEHPPISDAYGRTWIWWKGDLYRHDDTLAVPKDMIEIMSLPRPGLAEDNPNYTNLCSICRRTAPAGD